MEAGLDLVLDWTRVLAVVDLVVKDLGLVEVDHLVCDALVGDDVAGNAEGPRSQCCWRCEDAGRSREGGDDGGREVHVAD
jgi:hypothetical protein